MKPIMKTDERPLNPRWRDYNGFPKFLVLGRESPRSY